MRQLTEHSRRLWGFALRMTGICKRFGPVEALREVSFSVRSGTVHALVGENGAGKSTLMKILAGVYQSDGGSIEVAGQGYVFEGPQQALEAGVSMIYQDLELAEHLTAAENIFLGNEPRGIWGWLVDRQGMLRQAVELAERFGFGIEPELVVAEMSTGDCQIVAILKALARNASILVMDEPTSSLSEAESQRLFDVVRRLRQEGITVIYISHRLEEVMGLADEITVLRDGCVVGGDLASNMDIGQIVRLMVGRELKEFFPARQAKVGRVRVRVSGVSSRQMKGKVSFEIRAGEVVGMAGLVGAGRTEVARAIFGVEARTSGSVLLDGEQVEVDCPADAISAGIALLTEDRKRTGLCGGLACSWNVTLAGLDLIGMRRLIRPAREDAIASEMAGRLSIKWPGPQSAVECLSGGNQQKLLLARWLLAEARFLIFDEPTRGIDVGAKKEVYVLLNRLAEQGKAQLIISSELDELFGITDRILVMRRGRLMADLTTAETSQEQVMHLAAVEEH